MAKTDVKALMKETGVEAGPPSLKRTAPKLETRRKRKKKYTTEEERQEAQGIRVTYRVKPATREAVIRFTDEKNIKIGQFVDFSIRAMLELIEKGRVELPFENDDKSGYYEIRLPDIPERFR